MISQHGLSFLLGSAGTLATIGLEHKARAYPTPEGCQIIRYDSQHGSYRYVFSDGTGQAQAALQVMARKSGGQGKIANVYTAPKSRRQGLASQILRLAQEDFASIEHSSDLSDDGQAWVDGIK